MLCILHFFPVSRDIVREGSQKTAGGSERLTNAGTMYCTTGGGGPLLGSVDAWKHGSTEACVGLNNGIGTASDVSTPERSGDSRCVMYPMPVYENSGSRHDDGPGSMPDRVGGGKLLHCTVHCDQPDAAPPSRPRARPTPP